MALPVTITGISTAVAPVGPFKATNGNYYFFGRDGTTATTLQAYKNIVASTIYTIATDALTNQAFGNNANTARCYQTFTTGASDLTITSVTFALSKNGAPTDNIVADIYLFDTGTNLPTGSSLGTSAARAGSTLTTSTVRYAFTFATPVVISPSTRYAVALSRSTAIDSANYYKPFRDSLTLNVDATQGFGTYSTTFSVWATPGNTDLDLTVAGTALSSPDTSWASIATKTGFTTAILKLDAYQVGNVVHLLVQDGTASTALATKYSSFDASTDTFLATTETVSAAVAVTGQVAGANAGASLVVRSNGNVVAFYSGVQTKTSGTFRARVYYRERTGVNTWGTETQVDANAALDTNYPIAVLGLSNRVHLVWGVAPSSVGYRTLSAANALSTAASSASLTAPGDGVSYDRSGTTKVVVTSNSTGQTVMRFDSSDNPTPSFSTPTAANATLPHRIGTFPNTDDVTIVYRNSADSDMYSIKSSDDGATFGTAVSFFVGTVASADANVSRSSSGSVYARGSNNVVGYLVNDGGTLKYNENVVSTSSTNYTDTITPSALPIVGAAITPVAVIRTDYTDTLTPSSVPIVGSTVTPIYTANYADTITPSALPIGGATLAADVFASQDTLSAGAVPIVGAALADVFAHSDTLTPSSVPIVGAALAPVLAFADTISAGAVPIVGSTIAPVYTVNYADTLTASALPITGQTIAPVYSVGSISYTDTIAPSAVPIAGQTVAPIYAYADSITPSAVPIVGAVLADTFARSDTISPSAVPIVGAAIAPTYSAKYSDSLTASALPIGGQAIAPIYTANYADTLTASAVPIAGASLADTFARTETVTAGALPITGQTLADIYSRTDTLTAGALPITGSAIAPIYTVAYVETLTAGSLPITGQAVTPVWSAGAINYTETILVSLVPIGGATIAPIYTANYSDTLTASSVPINGAVLADIYGHADTLTAGAVPIGGTALADTFARSDSLVAGTLPIGGQTITPVYTARYSDTISAGALPIAGRAITPVWSAGAINYSDTIAPGAVPIAGQAVAAVYTVRYADTITASAVPIVGQTVAPVFSVGTANYTDTISPSALPLIGQTVTPIASLNASPIKIYGIVAVQTEPGIIVGRRTPPAAITGNRTPPTTVTAQQTPISAIVAKQTAPAFWDARQ